MLGQRRQVMRHPLQLRLPADTCSCMQRPGGVTFDSQGPKQWASQCSRVLHTGSPQVPCISAATWRQAASHCLLKREASRPVAASQQSAGRAKGHPRAAVQA